MKSFPWKCLKFKSTGLWTFVFFFLEQPGHWFIAVFQYQAHPAEQELRGGRKRIKVQDWLLSNPKLISGYYSAHEQIFL